MTDWDTARRCPTCNANGKESQKKPAPSGDGFLITLYCTNKKCADMEIPWYVQVRSDGTIPNPTPHNMYTAMIDPKMVNPELAQQIRDAVQAQNVLSKKPGGEIV